MTDLEAVATVKGGSIVRGGHVTSRYQADLAFGLRRRFCDHAGSLIAGS